VDRIVHAHHRSGWAYALDSLAPLLSADGSGVLFDSSVEQSFWKRLEEQRRSGRLPYLKPWVGIVHNPPNIPSWHERGKSTSYIFRLATWRRSLEHCRGLFALSEDSARWLRARVDFPVSVLRHPTGPPFERWSPRKFRANRDKRLLQVGWWLRKLSSIHFVRPKRLGKTMIRPGDEAELTQRLHDYAERERARTGAPPIGRWDAEPISPVSDRRYDALLARNVVFLDLLGSVANNTVIECIVRRTPVLVNPLPAVVEYLGEDYPLYFRDLGEAAEKADDFGLLERAHEYLKGIPEERFSGETFRRTVAESEVYRGLGRARRRS